MTPLEQRQFKSTIEKFKHPGYSICSRCWLPWPASSGTHNVLISTDTACFALCTDCWNESNTAERELHYMAVIQEWQQKGYPPVEGMTYDEMAEAIKTNIRTSE